MAYKSLVGFCQSARLTLGSLGFADDLKTSDSRKLAGRQPISHLRDAGAVKSGSASWRIQPLVRAAAECTAIRGATLPAGPGGGSGVLDKPVIERPTPGRESEFDVKRKKKMSPPYRVLLHNDNFNRREYVVQVLMKVIPGMTVDQAVNIMQEAHVNGMACVIVCAQEDAEEHCQGLRTNGLIASIEPANKC